MRSWLAAVALLGVAVVPIAAAQTDLAPASAQEGAATVKVERTTVRMADGRSGWVSFDLQGTERGRVSGLLLAEIEGPDGKTEYRSSSGSVQRNETGWEFVMQGAARTTRPSGETTTGRFSSRLTVKRADPATAAKPIGRLKYEDITLKVNSLGDDDIWIIDGLKCVRSNGDLVCN